MLGSPLHARDPPFARVRHTWLCRSRPAHSGPIVGKREVIQMGTNRPELKRPRAKSWELRHPIVPGAASILHSEECETQNYTCSTSPSRATISYNTGLT